MSLNGMQRLWNDEDRKAVAILLRGGASASDVGNALGLTRNAAIGRIARDPDLHKLMRPGNPVRPSNYVPLHSKVKVTAPSLPPPEPPRPKGNPMPLAATGTKWCKWPIAFDPEVEGTFWCCGAAVMPGDVYCAYHRNRARPG